MVYALDLAKAQQEFGDDVSLLTMGSFSLRDSRPAIIRAKRYNNLTAFEIRNPLPYGMSNGIANPDLYLEHKSANNFKSFFEHEKYDVVHVHSLIGLYPSVLRAAKQAGAKIVYTTHDYYGICCKPERLRYNDEICEAKNFDRCYECAKYAFGYRRMQIEQTKVFQKAKSYAWFNRFMDMLMHVRAKLRNSHDDAQQLYEQVEEILPELVKQYKLLENQYRQMLQMMDVIHFNSSQTRKIYEAYMGPMVGKVIPIMTAGICDKRCHRDRINEESLHIGFIGNSKAYKGLPDLVKCLDEINKEKNKIILHTYGVLEYADRTYMVHHKSFTQNELDKVYAEFDLLVVPSLWQETFSIVTLEAISRGMPCIVSEHVGAKDIVRRIDEELIFHNLEDLKYKLENAYDNSSKLDDYKNKLMSLNMDFDFGHYVQEMKKELYR